MPLTHIDCFAVTSNALRVEETCVFSALICK